MHHMEEAVKVPSLFSLSLSFKLTYISSTLGAAGAPTIDENKVKFQISDKLKTAVGPFNLCTRHVPRTSIGQTSTPTPYPVRPYPRPGYTWARLYLGSVNLP